MANVRMTPDQTRLLLSHPEDALLATKRWWTFFYPLPMPSQDLCEELRCPACGDPNILLKQWTYHRFDRQEGKTYPDRVDVTFKCRRCAHVFNHGVLLPPDTYDWQDGKNRRWTRRQGLAEFRRRGLTDEEIERWDLFERR